MGIFSIAGILTEMEPKGGILLRNSAKYAVSKGVPQISLAVSDSDIEENINRHPDVSWEMWEYLLYGILFYKHLIDLDGFMLHASAVAVDGRAYLFTGNPGAGKSTHTAQWKKLFGDRAVILNDDKPAVRFIDGKYMVFGTPFSGKNDISENLSAELAGICFVEKSCQNKIEPMGMQEFLPKIMQQTLYRLPPKQMDNLLKMFDGMLKTLPVFRLKCNISTDAAQLAFDAMNK